MYKPLQKKDSSWNPTSIQKKGKGKSGTFTVQTFRDNHEDVPKAPRVAAAGMVENVMRAMAAREQENNRTAAVEHQSPAIETATPEVQSKEIGIQLQCAECAKEKQQESAAEEKDVSEMSVGASRIQTKLTVGAPGDPYEQEADRVAAQVMSMSVAPEASPQVQRLPEERWFKAPSITPVVQRQVEPKVQMWQLLQRAGGGHEASGDLESRLNASKGGGSALAPEVRAFMEPRFGADFSAVRVHTGGEAVQMNQELGAQAFAHGSDVYFGAGKEPGNNELTAHELTHVVQQTESPWVQRDPLGFQKQPIIDALNKKLEPDYVEAYHLLNGLAMFDILSTLNALKRSGQFDQLNSNLSKAVGVNTPRLQIAFLAVLGKADPEMFMFRHGHELQTLPQEQRLDILNFIDALWVDELKLTEDENALIGQIRANTVFLALAPDDKKLAEEIIAEAQKRRMKSFHSSVHCLEKLKLLFETPEENPDKQSAATQASTDTATKQEKNRLSKPAAVKQLDLEEKASKKSSKKMIPVTGKFGGGTYYVDNSDPAHIVVKAKVFLQVTTNGSAKNIANSKKTIPSIKKMEDAIEKAASNKGYLVDIVFVKAPDPDTFTVEVDPSNWETATNWSGGDPAAFAHELHHLMAFPLDRYDYIESHAGNKDMKIPDRLYWFSQELNKADDYNDPTSIMNDNRNPNDSDVCTVAQLDVATCTAARQAALSKNKP